MQVHDVEVLCPYCGEAIYLEVDPSVPNQSYIEDCQVCCRPIQVHAAFDSNFENCNVRAERSDS